jgi:hypothetical protein
LIFKNIIFDRHHLPAQYDSRDCTKKFIFAKIRGHSFLFFPFWKWKESESATSNPEDLNDLKEVKELFWTDQIYRSDFSLSVPVIVREARADYL